MHLDPTPATAPSGMPFAALGHRNGVFWFQRQGDAFTIGYTADQLDETAILWLAPRTWWAARCGRDTPLGFALDIARTLLTQACTLAGAYPSRPARLATGDGAQPDLERVLLRAELLAHVSRYAVAGAPSNEAASAILRQVPLWIRQDSALDLERHWTLDGQLTAAEARALRSACRLACLEDARPETLIDLARWLGLLPSAPADAVDATDPPEPVAAASLTDEDDHCIAELRALAVELEAGLRRAGLLGRPGFDPDDIRIPAAELLPLPDLDRPRLLADLLPSAVSAVRSRQGRFRKPEDYYPPADDIRAEADLLEQSWTLSGRLTAAEALILREACRFSLPSTAGYADLAKMATWLGLPSMTPAPEAA